MPTVVPGPQVAQPRQEATTRSQPGDVQTPPVLLSPPTLSPGVPPQPQHPWVSSGCHTSLGATTRPWLGLGTPLVTLHGKGTWWWAGRGHRGDTPHCCGQWVSSPLPLCWVSPGVSHTHWVVSPSVTGDVPSMLSVTSGYRDQCGPQCSVVLCFGWPCRATPCRVTSATCHGGCDASPRPATGVGDSQPGVPPACPGAGVTSATQQAAPCPQARAHLYPSVPPNPSATSLGFTCLSWGSGGSLGGHPWVPVPPLGTSESHGLGDGGTI